MAGRWIATIFGSAVLLAVLAIGAIGAVLVLSVSTRDSLHDFASPSGAIDLYFLESCERGGCTHQAVLERAGPGGDATQVRCGLDIEAAEPAFARLDVEWSDAEDGVAVRFSGRDGVERSFALDFARDCNT